MINIQMVKDAIVWVVVVTFVILLILSALTDDADADTIVIVVAHGDDVVTSMNYLGDRCLSPSNKCVAVIATDASRWVGDDEAFPAFNIERVYMGLPDLPGDVPQSQVIDTWELRGGLQDCMIRLYTLYNPDQILLLDPRHGVGGHTSHMTLGWHAISAANRAGFGDRVLVSSVIRHISDDYFDGTGYPIDRGENFHGFRECVQDDPHAMVVYDGWNNTEMFLSYYPSLFDSQKLLMAPREWRVNVILRWNEQNPMDYAYNGCVSIWR